MALTRVYDNGFCDGDVMGVYVVDYNGGTPGTLKLRDNRCDNVRHTFDEANNQWEPAYDIYWKDKHTHIDVYGYYPFANPESIDDYQFEVQKDQSRASADGEWANTEKIVLAPNLVRKASINFATGEVKPSGSVESTSTMPSHVDDEWRTIVVPQTVEAGTTLFSITIGGMPYKFVKNAALTYVSGKMMNFSIKVDKKAASGQYKLTLVSESIATPPTCQRSSTRHR
ncbi:fimbrillin family protein [Leyella stercorea]|uniref:fimbrillin family protein n=1 Tax=Leyella stercorea TaxID=363265 RepID=UPI00243257B9|nr:fimbrillin family protein [Leyella stercorea]